MIWRSRASCEASICASRFSALLRPMVASTDLRSKARTSSVRAMRFCRASAEQALGGGGARLQRVEPHVEAVALGLVLFLGFVERGGEPAAFGVGLGEARLDLAELRARGGQRVLAFGQAAGEAGGLVERLIDRDLQRALLVFEQRQLLARAGELAFELDVALFGDVELLFEDAAAFGQRAALRAFLRELALDLDDLRVARVDLVGQFEPRALQAAVRSRATSSRSSRSFSASLSSAIAFFSTW